MRTRSLRRPGHVAGIVLFSRAHDDTGMPRGTAPLLVGERFDGSGRARKPSPKIHNAVIPTT